MTDSQIRQKIAEKCGWKPPKQGSVLWTKNEGVEWADKNHLPNYPNDLNAMHCAEECLSGDHWADYFSWLQRNGKATGVRATARQRAEAFLKVFGLWKD